MDTIYLCTDILLDVEFELITIYYYEFGMI